ncbi:hypothetical protein NIES2109_16940 [Nostoc sp. HK-01]|uniref:DUF1877 family protein n=1 Tax=Nostoc cycadae WK-1 TaxID=1861711 RepID=A0A2H6LFD4_9NOSO|nr:DUF1877 family protein [Nostoc cycadae]BBD58915.1 hypothetical protein NIES2109_16940 [Nostoc sp. HK-01]GBE91937.1 hypothetical protein NCWK1_1690 [Nostoc cycadae WK-1]
MGTTLELKQVSPYLLEKIKNYSELAGIFLDAQYLEDSPFWEEFTIDPNDIDDVEWFNEATNYLQERLDKLVTHKPEKFGKMKDDIPLIINEGKSKYLDLDKTWQPINFLLTGYEFYDEEFHLSKLVVSENLADNLPLIRAVSPSQGIEYDGGDYPLYYFSVDEVQQIAKALSDFSMDEIRQRLKFRGLPEDSYNHLFDYTYNPLVKYYQDAAAKGNAMFLEFG